MKEKIIELLHEFQETYDKKDVNNVDQFMKKLFIDKENISILGTSFGELCLGYDECKKLFTDDWEYWSFEHLDFDHLIIKDYEDAVLVYAPAYFSFTFKHNNYGDYIDELKDQLNDSKNLQKDLTEINWIIAHFLHEREIKDRKYMLDLRLCFIFVKTNNEFKVKQIQFSVPEDYSDTRLALPEIKSAYESEIEKYLAHKTAENIEIQDVLKPFSHDFMNLDIDEMIHKYFDLENLLILHVDNQIAENLEDLKLLIKDIRKNWQSIEINSDVAYIKNNGKCVSILSNGLGKSYIDEETFYKNTKDKIIKIANGNLHEKEKLFVIRKEISTAMRDVSVSNEYDWPIRVHMLMKKHENRWLIQYLQFSYPFYYILENKNQFMKLV
ncbi:hypothetical protein KHQ81_02190 [Mycoplasmatota bacterium]|nr:hypothetical protein KHQ81_02190 [Mycoplasmatota bacterium]